MLRLAVKTFALVFVFRAITGMAAHANSLADDDLSRKATMADVVSGAWGILVAPLARDALVALADPIRQQVAPYHTTLPGLQSPPPIVQPKTKLESTRPEPRPEPSIERLPLVSGSSLFQMGDIPHLRPLARIPEAEPVPDTINRPAPLLGQKVEAALPTVVGKLVERFKPFRIPVSDNSPPEQVAAITPIPQTAHPRDAEDIGVVRRIAYDQQVPACVLYSIVDVETQWHPWSVGTDSPHIFSTLKEMEEFASNEIRKGTPVVDIGLAQINYRYHGEHFGFDIMKMSDPRANLEYAAHFLNQLSNTYVKWSDVAAAYHGASDKAETDRYIKMFKKAMRTCNATKLEKSEKLFTKSLEGIRVGRLTADERGRT